MVITRFAPSPTGHLHLGHAFSAYTAWKRAAGGRFLLRIEDIDPTRCRPEYTAALQQDLIWLGLIPHEPPRIQSEHLADYHAVLNELSIQNLIYPCFCSRRDVAASASAPHAPDGTPLYPGTCRRLSKTERDDRIAAGHPFAMRLDMAAANRPGLSFQEETEDRIECHPERFGDIVLARKDAPASYHLCVTHDDALQQITHVTRGHDLQSATDIHRLLQTLMGWPEPVYAHHRLLTDHMGRRLAKRDKAQTLRSLRDQGVTPQSILRQFDQSH
jgi:glutamyl-Q tRNA(Asp) synthetase